MRKQYSSQCQKVKNASNEKVSRTGKIKLSTRTEWVAILFIYFLLSLEEIFSLLF